MRDTLLALHVLAGTAGLLLGPAWLAARLAGRRAWAVATGYQGVLLVVSATGGALALMTPGLAWLLSVAVLTAGMAVGGALARRRGWRRWRTLQPHLLGGSYIALMTAFLVIQTGSPVMWVLPAVVGQVPIALAKRRLQGKAPAIA